MGEIVLHALCLENRFGPTEHPQRHEPCEIIDSRKDRVARYVVPTSFEVLRRLSRVWFSVLGFVTNRQKGLNRRSDIEGRMAHAERFEDIAINIFGIRLAGSSTQSQPQNAVSER